MKTLRLWPVSLLLVSTVFASNSFFQSPETQQFGDVNFSLVVQAEGQQSGRGLSIDKNGYIYVLEYYYVDHHEVRVARITPDGQLDTEFQYPVTGFAYTSGMAVSDTGEVYVTGWAHPDFPTTANAFQPVSGGSGDAFIVKWKPDGQVEFATYLGGSHPDQGLDIAMTPTGNIVVVGATYSPNFYTVNPIQENLTLTQCFCYDVFVTEMTPDGSQILFSTYLGGSFVDKGQRVAVTQDNQIVVAGTTESDDFPLVSPFQSVNQGEGDGFIFEISADRTQLVYSSFVGGEDVEYIGDLAVDLYGYALLGGTTQSIGFPTTPGAFEPDFVGGINACGGGAFIPIRNCSDFFVVKVDPFGNQVFGTYLGSKADDAARGITSDLTGRVYVVGYGAGGFPGVPDPNWWILATILDPTGSEVLGTFAYDSPVANAGHGIGVNGSQVIITGGDEVPSNLYVSSFDSGLADTCPDLVLPMSIGTEDLQNQASQWHSSGFQQPLDLNGDGRLDMLDMLMLTNEMGQSCP